MIESDPQWLHILELSYIDFKTATPSKSKNKEKPSLKFEEETGTGEEVRYFWKGKYNNELRIDWMSLIVV